jgi:hypothetical protein
MRLSTTIPLIAALLAAPLAAQSASSLKKELRKRESAAKKDPEAIFEAGSWARENKLEKDAIRLFNKVLKLASDHVGAHTALGDELIEGKWLPAKEAKKLRDKALEAEYSAKGYKNIDGIWVAPEAIEDAQKGIFHHNEEKVTRDEMIAFQAGKVRHPVTGRLIDADKLEKAKSGYFPLRNGKWGDQAEANKFHSELSRPWLVRTQSAQILSTLPIEKLEGLKINIEQGIEKVSPLFGGRVVTPSKRPLVIIAKTQSEYLEYGKSLGDGSDVAGAFLITDEAEFSIGDQGRVRPAVCENHKDWGVRNMRHAAAIAYVNAIAEEAGADLPLWFVHGVGSYTSRFENDSDAGWFGKTHLTRGGVSNIKSFFKTFTLSSDLQSAEIAFNLYQAGLMLSFATQGGNKEVTDAMVAVTDALSGKGKASVGKAISKLEGLLAGAQDQVTEHLKKLVAKAPQ